MTDDDSHWLDKFQSREDEDLYNYHWHIYRITEEDHDNANEKEAKLYGMA